MGPRKIQSEILAVKNFNRYFSHDICESRDICFRNAFSKKIFVIIYRRNVHVYRQLSSLWLTAHISPTLYDRRLHHTYNVIAKHKNQCCQRKPTLLRWPTWSIELNRVNENPLIRSTSIVNNYVYLILPIYDQYRFNYVLLNINIVVDNLLWMKYEITKA